MNEAAGTSLSFAERVAKLREKVRPQAPNPGFDFSADVPEVEEQRELVLSEEELELDKVIKDVTIIEAYNRWSGKKILTESYKSETKVSCPNATHPDKNPSAWINKEKGVWHCATCGGGDIWDIAAYSKGYPVPGYKGKENFRKLREEIALDLGYRVMRSEGKTTIVKGDQKEEKHVVPDSTTPSVATEAPEIDADEEEASIDWRSILPNGTFLREWMEATTHDWCPEEYHFFTGVAALGFALQRNVLLVEDPPVAANFNITLLGRSTVRKSKAKDNLRAILEMTMPYNSETNGGVKRVGGPSSGEMLITQFEYYDTDPSDPTIKEPATVAGYVEYDEMASLITTANRAGNSLSTSLMGLYDGRDIYYSSRMGGDHRAHKPFGTCVSTTQNDSIKELFSRKDEGSGFLNRWLFITGKAKPEPHRSMWRTDLTKPASILGPMYMIHKSYANINGPRMVDWTEEGEKIWKEFWEDTVLPDLLKSAKDSQLTLRIKLTLFKLQLIFAANMGQTEITREAVDQMKQIYPYLLHTYGIVRKDMNRTEQSDIRDKVLEHIRSLHLKNKKWPTKREITQRVHRLIKGDDNLLVRTLKNMEDLGIIASGTERRGKRTVTFWEVVREEDENEA